MYFNISNIRIETLFSTNIFNTCIYANISSNAPSSLIYSIKNDYGAIPNGFVETCMIC